MTDPIRIFIGTSANNEDIEFDCTVHYTLEKHASRPLDITWMRLSKDPSSFWYSNPGTREGWQTQDRSWRDIQPVAPGGVRPLDVRFTLPGH